MNAETKSRGEVLAEHERKERAKQVGAGVACAVAGFFVGFCVGVATTIVGIVVNFN